MDASKRKRFLFSMVVGLIEWPGAGDLGKVDRNREIGQWRIPKMGK